MAFGHDGRSVYFCVDVEASGPVPGRYNLISIGAVEVRWDGARHRRGDELYVELEPVFDGWDPGAEKVHKLTRDHLMAHGEKPEAALRRVNAWVGDHLRERERPVFVGHNAPFDWMQVAWYYDFVGLPNPFGYKALDTKAMMMGKHHIQWADSHKERLLELYPSLQAPAPEMVHNALADAVFQADILIALLDD